MHVDRDYVWHASGGRMLFLREMTAEHIVNTLNYIESGRHTPRTADASAKRAEDYFQLRCEAIRRGLRWRDYADQPPLHDGDLHDPARWTRTRTKAEAGAGAGVEVPTDLVGRTVSIGLQVSDKIMSLDGTIKWVRPFTEPTPDLVNLADIKPGEKFVREVAYAWTRTAILVRLNPIGYLLNVMKGERLRCIDGAFFRPGDPTARYLVADSSTGATYFLPGYERVRRISGTTQI